MDIIEITYCFKLGGGREELFRLQIDSATLELIDDETKPLPEWAALDFHQCPNCPHTTQADSHCLVAKKLAPVIERFNDICSYDEIDLEVITDERRVQQHTTAQRAISSLLGLMFATSGCDHTAYMKPMARFHLPLASQEETTFRAAGMYLLAQFFRQEAGQDGKLDMTGLKKIYNDLHTINVAITERIRDARRTEASVNAIVLLDTRANLMPFMIEDHFDEIRHLFDAYLTEDVDENKEGATSDEVVDGPGSA